MCQTKTMGLSIEATLGGVERVDANEKGFCLGNFIRIRVLMDISMPLCQGRKVRLGKHGLKWVDFKYERLPIFSYLCGRVDHDERNCLQGLQSKETLRPEEKQFDPWLHAIQDKLQKPLIVIAARNEVTRIKEAETKSGEHRLVGIVESTSVFDIPRIDHPCKMEWRVGARANVGNANTPSSHIQVKIPKIPLISNFEQ